MNVQNMRIQLAESTLKHSFLQDGHKAAIKKEERQWQKKSRQLKTLRLIS